MLTRRHFLSGTGAGLFLSGYPVHGFTKEAVSGRIVVTFRGWNGWASCRTTNR
ncbi:MAG: hypothetical protein O3A15_07685 [Proteobacteria bacterium]|nr:hypothetical protein [Pseudomonadota bacterium]